MIDYRIYDPDSDGKTKIDHVSDMINSLLAHKQLPFCTVLMDSWYATKNLMLLIDSLGKIYYCPLKKNRLVDDTAGVEKYKPIQHLAWSDEDKAQGKVINLNGFPAPTKVKQFLSHCLYRQDGIRCN